MLITIAIATNSSKEYSDVCAKLFGQNFEGCTHNMCTAIAFASLSQCKLLSMRMLQVRSGNSGSQQRNWLRPSVGCVHRSF